VEWLWYSAKSSPANHAALNIVVMNWLIPPPGEGASLPSRIVGASTHPFSTVRSPMNLLNENVSPGRMTTPRTMSARLWMFCTRGAKPGCFVVNVDTASLIPSALTSAVLTAGGITFVGNATGPVAGRSPSALTTTSAASEVQHVWPSTLGETPGTSSGPSVTEASDGRVVPAASKLARAFVMSSLSNV